MACGLAVSSPQRSLAADGVDGFCAWVATTLKVLTHRTRKNGHLLSGFAPHVVLVLQVLYRNFHEMFRALSRCDSL